MYLNKYLSFSGLILTAGAASLQAAELSTVGQVMPMVHISIEFNESTGTLGAYVDSEIPQLTPLSIASPGDSFNPADPWYTTLDPSQEGQAFTRRFGFVSTLDPAPSNRSFWISLDAPSAGLEAYYYRETPATFDPIFGTDGSDFIWEYPDSMTHPVFSTLNTGNISLSGTIYIGDATGAIDNTYAAAPFTLNFTAVPEPGTYALIAGLSMLGLVALRRRQRG